MSRGLIIAGYAFGVTTTVIGLFVFVVGILVGAPVAVVNGLLIGMIGTGTALHAEYRRRQWFGTKR